MRERLVGGDWARILGLYLVILGHFFPGMVKSFIFSFHVPFSFSFSFSFSFLYQGILLLIKVIILGSI